MIRGPNPIAAAKCLKIVKELIADHETAKKQQKQSIGAAFESIGADSYRPPKSEEPAHFVFEDKRLEKHIRDCLIKACTKANVAPDAIVSNTLADGKQCITIDASVDSQQDVSNDPIVKTVFDVARSKLGI